jgi:hypothetical protein
MVLLDFMRRDYVRTCAQTMAAATSRAKRSNSHTVGTPPLDLSNDEKCKASQQVKTDPAIYGCPINGASALYPPAANQPHAAGKRRPNAAETLESFKPPYGSCIDD